MEIIFSIVLSLLLGVVLGATHLVFKPVEKKKEKELAAAPAPASVLYHSVQFVEGTTAGGAGWLAKKQAFVSGTPGSFTLNEAELNTLIATLAPPPPAPKPAAPPASATPGKPASPADKAKETKPAPPAAPAAAPAFTAAQLAPGVINFRVHGGVLQAAMAGSFNLAGLEIAPLVQLRGDFGKGADGFVFQPAEFYVGSLPVHRIPGLSAWLLNKMLAAQKSMPEDLKTAWQKLGAIAIEGDTLRLSPP